MMRVATCRIELRIEAVSSLKEKRRIVKSVMARLSNEFNVAVAEVEHQDVWQTAVIGLAAIGTDSAILHSVMEKAVSWVERHRLDAYLVRYDIEMR